jgi:glycosyltransferase involved in cell wall biosynthesis
VIKILKIAFLIDCITSDRAGTEKQLLEIIRRLDRGSFEPLLICLASTPWLENADVPCRYSVLGYKGFLERGLHGVISKLKSIIENEHIDILQSFFNDSIFLAYLGSFKSKRRPVLISSRRDMGLGEDNPWYHSIYGFLLPFVNRRFDRIAANSEVVKKFVSRREKTPLERIVVMPNGISLPEEHYEKPEVFRLNRAEIWIGMAANLKPVKRVDVFIDALHYLKSRTKVDFHALIMGDGRLRNELESKAARLGLADRLHFVGSVCNVYAYLKNMHIGVLCSEREGFSNSVMEYMACGLPVVATSVGGNVELIDDGINGILVPAVDSTSLGEALITLSNDRVMRKRMGDASFRKVSERYSWDIVMEKWQSFYKILAYERNLT